MSQERDLLLITGIPGTGKTTYSDKFAQAHGFLHHDLEDVQTQTLNRFNANPTQFIEELLNKGKASWSRGALGRIASDQFSLCSNSEMPGSN